MLKPVRLLILLVTLLCLSLVVKGQIDNGRLDFQHDKSTAVGGPFESSNSTSRYALTEALAINHTVYFTKDEAAFALPDLASRNGKYFTIFTPGVSFIGVPFFLLGSLLGIPQLMTYMATTLFALVNVFLIYLISRKLGTGKLVALIGGLIFLFGTNGLAYSQTFTQHHYTVAVLLASVLIAMEPVTFVRNILLGFLFGMGILIDIPNILLLLPVGLMVLFKHLKVSGDVKKIRFSINLEMIGVLIGILPLLVLFFWYNIQTTGAAFVPAQITGRTKSLDQTIKQEVLINERKTSFAYNTRNLVNGIYILVFSDERGWFYYSPVMAVGLLGLFFLLKNQSTQKYGILLISIILVDFVSYAMFGDPWGGWSFGARYLIPASAAACVGIGPVLKKYGKNAFFSGIFSIVLISSLYVNGLGVMTTAAVPPKIEAKALLTPVPYTYQYNLRILQKNFSGSLIYRLYFSQILQPGQYLIIWILSVYLFLAVIYILSLKKYEI